MTSHKLAGFLNVKHILIKTMASIFAAGFPGNWEGLYKLLENSSFNTISV